MKKNMKITGLTLALVLALALGAAALAENPAEAPSDSAAAEAAKSAMEGAQAAADAAQAEAAALSEALEAYGKAKAESRRIEMLTGLKEELDGYVAAGSLTQEQADLILKYYAEQLTLQQNIAGSGKGGRMKNGGMNGSGFGRNGQTLNGSMNGIGGQDGRGGHGRFGQPQNGTQQNAAPEANASPDAGGV